MATGNPLLMVWRLSDTTLRLFQFSPTTGFVQLGATSLPHTASGDPVLEFSSDEAFAFLGYIASTGFAIYALRELDANFTLRGSTVQVNDGTVIPKLSRVIEGYVIEGESSDQKILGIRDRKRTYLADGNPNRAMVVEPDATTQLSNSNKSFVLTDRTVYCTAVHPSYKCIFIGASPSSALSMRTADSAAPFVNSYPQFNTALDKQVDVPSNVTIAKWSSDGKYLYTVDNYNRLQVFEYVESNVAHKRLVFLHSTQLSYAPYKLKICPDNKRIALVQNDGTYTTRIYERKAHLLELQQTIATFGYGLDWSADSSLLIDALSKKLFLWDATNKVYNERSDLITAIPAGGTTQALSKHRLIPVRASTFAYNSAVLDIVNSDIDTTNLKAFFYTDLMERFDPTELPDDSKLIYRNGKKLQNVSLDFSTDIPKLSADPVKQIFTATSKFRYVIVKDMTNNIGVAMYDFLGDVEVTQFKELTLTFTDGVLSFS